MKMEVGIVGTILEVEGPEVEGEEDISVAVEGEGIMEVILIHSKMEVTIQKALFKSVVCVSYLLQIFLVF